MESKYLCIRDIILKNIRGIEDPSTSLKSVRIICREEPTQFLPCFYNPICALVVQGEKHILYGSKKLIYGKGQYLISCTDIPVSSRVSKASSQEPFVALILELDMHILSHLIVENNLQQPIDNNEKCLAITNIDHELLDAFYRLAQLIEKSSVEQEILSSIVNKEIYYRLLVGPLGNQLHLVNKKESRHYRIVQAIAFLKDRYREKLHIEDIARHVNMTLSSFYREFKKITKISPLQYQKQLRLHEAQRLLLTGEHNVESASYYVGYESPTQFSREYKKMFGYPPKTHVNVLVQK